jgi:hypothetical protein
MQDDESLVDAEQLNFTYSIPDANEVQAIIKEMKINATPGPDGLNAAFYKSTWSWIQDDVLKVVTEFYSCKSLHKDINQTYITFIPKKAQPTIPQDFRPISLSNVIYKIISKSLANRLKPHLPTCIHQGQSYFVSGHNISSNIIITQEIIHSFRLKSWNSQAFILKIDLAKAFDRLEWNFICDALKRKNFSDDFISLIHACIRSLHFLVLVNDEPTE